jgi:hypothetical protein
MDLAVMALDACSGLALALWLFAPPASIWVIALGAIAAMLPDPLQFAHSLFPREPLSTLQRFHGWIHSKRKLAWTLGVSLQVAFSLLLLYQRWPARYIDNADYAQLARRILKTKKCETEKFTPNAAMIDTNLATGIFTYCESATNIVVATTSPTIPDAAKLAYLPRL